MDSLFESYIQLQTITRNFVRRTFIGYLSTCLLCTFVLWKRDSNQCEKIQLNTNAIARHYSISHDIFVLLPFNRANRFNIDWHIQTMNNLFISIVKIHYILWICRDVSQNTFDFCLSFFLFRFVNQMNQLFFLANMFLCIFLICFVYLV